ncbi:zinc-dependent peptidase [bacterium]|nr:zinc-dependent peptidase [bacterium]
MANIGIILAILFCVYSAFKLFKESRRSRLRDLPFSPEWEEYIINNIPMYSVIPEKYKKELHGHIQVFLNEKSFEGCGGLELTDEIKVTIAAQACVLLLNRKTSYYNDLSSIIIYPSAYFGNMDGDFVHIENGNEVRLGESWGRGLIVLSWDDTLRGAKNAFDAENVVIHEFAHQLDQEDGSADGCPILENRSCYKSWGKVLSKEYEKLQKKRSKNRKAVINFYGATEPAEFFSCATEAFFEKSRQMQKKHPELYDELKFYYRLDPASWDEIERPRKKKKKR